MGGDAGALVGPDLQRGVPAGDVPLEGVLVGHAQGEAVLLSRRGGEFSAIGATCTHYSGPLGEGLVVGDTVRCPWHHACFSLRTGEALRAPALNDLPRWSVEERDGVVRVTGKLEQTPAPRAREKGGAAPESVVIVGGGAAGHAAAEMLRREGFEGGITIVDPDADAAVDRPNLSKDYLAGNAPEEWVPLRPASFFDEQGIQRVTARVAAIDAGAHRLKLSSGAELPYGALLLATGATPVRLPEHVTGGREVLYLRTLADSRAIIAAAGKAERAVVLGASFIGLEVAASLRARRVEVHVAAPEPIPLQRVMGDELGRFIQQLHEEHGVQFHLGRTASGMDARSVTLDNGETLGADLVVAGIGVRPNLSLAEQAELALDRGVLVDERLRTSAPDIFAAGDIARWPDPYTGDRIRVEHWALAQRMGQAAARSILGATERFDAVPFFWSAHYDVTIGYSGHAEAWDRIEISGSPQERDCSVRFLRDGRQLAIATINRDMENLRAEAALELAGARLQEV